MIENQEKVRRVNEDTMQGGPYIRSGLSDAPVKWCNTIKGKYSKPAGAKPLTHDPNGKAWRRWSFQIIELNIGSDLFNLPSEKEKRKPNVKKKKWID